MTHIVPIDIYDSFKIGLTSMLICIKCFVTVDKEFEDLPWNIKPDEKKSSDITDIHVSK